MGPAGDDDLELRRYLLGELTEAEREHAEERLLREPGVLEALDEIEDELTEAYLGGTLSPQERTQFEGHFLQSAAHRRQLEAARMLRESVAARGPVVRRARLPWRLALTAAALVLLVPAARLWWRPAPAPLPGGGQQAGSTPPSPSGPPSPTLTAGGEVLLALMPGQTMAPGGRRAEVMLGPRTEVLRLELLLEAEPVDGCQARLTADGREVWQEQDCRPLQTPDGWTVVLKAPAWVLRPGAEHQVKLLAGRGERAVPVGTYWFRVSAPTHSP
jgi:hypothetical protein